MSASRRGAASTAARAAYRVRQFWNVLRAAPDPVDLEIARRSLTSEEWELFSRLQPSEQAHSIHGYKILSTSGPVHPDLAAAALLHDVGKTCHRLSIFDRVVIVLGRAIFPRRVPVWGAAEPRGWRRPFVVAEQHPAWGAELAARAGASPLAAALIRRHQEKLISPPAHLEEELLKRLQAVDDES